MKYLLIPLMFLLGFLTVVALVDLLITMTPARSENACQNIEWSDTIYHSKCYTCHDHLRIAPNFKKGKGLDDPDEELIAIIRNGKRIMPSWKDEGWTDEELENLVCYLKTLHKNK